MLKSLWTRVGAVVTPILFLIPVLALLGFVEGGKHAMTRLDGLQAGHEKIDHLVGLMTQAAPLLKTIHETVFLVYGALVLMALVIMTVRIMRRRGRPVTISYDGGVIISGPSGLSILDLSQLNNVPHASICGGRGRCGTCLVAVQQQNGLLTPVHALEAQTLHHCPPFTPLNLALNVVCEFIGACHQFYSIYLYI
ncbi:MAG TPA: hypothetical protein DDW73_01075 [Rhizobium sp.]|nr:hypothetical protein [Rhizobium sp.]